AAPVTLMTATIDGHRGEHVLVRMELVGIGVDGEEAPLRSERGRLDAAGDDSGLERGRGRADLSREVAISRSNIGGAAKLALGKEWWVSRKWGLGVNLESVAGVVPDDATKDKGWGFFSLDLAMSATYR